MTRFESPALHAEFRLPAAVLRGALALAALAFTAALWFAAASQAGQFGGRDTALHVTLDPVVIDGHRLAPDGRAYAMAPVAVDCGNTSAAAGPKPVTLSQ